MILVVPMAGRGQRFKDAGFTTPKPFIDVRGEWIVEWALKGFDLSKFDKIIFLILKEHDSKFGAVKKLKKKYGKKCVCILVSKVTAGPAATILLAKKYINTDEDMIAKDSDGYLVSNIHDTIEKNRNSDIRGIISTIELSGDRWSFARTDKRGIVVEVAEKKRISKNAITGLYYFRHGRDFVKYAEKIVREDKRVANGELYISTMYQEMVNDGKKLIIDKAHELWDLGVPASLEHFLKNF